MVPTILIAILALMAGTCLLYWKTCLSRPGDNPGLCRKESSQLRIATVNICGFGMLPSALKVADFLLTGSLDMDIDILLIQEYRSVYKLSDNDFKALFGKHFPYVITRGEQAIASRCPIVSSEFTSFPGSPDSFASYQVMDTDCDTLNIISVHLQTTGLHAMEKDGQSLRALSTVLSGNDKVRKSQAMTVRRKIEAIEGPVIVAGDFNSIPLSKPYRIVKGKSLADTYMEKGHGKGSTFRFLYDLLKIDYIMHSRHLECIDCVILNDYISDHRMIVSTLEKTEQ